MAQAPQESVLEFTPPGGLALERRRRGEPVGVRAQHERDQPPERLRRREALPRLGVPGPVGGVEEEFDGELELGGVHRLRALEQILGEPGEHVGVLRGDLDLEVTPDGGRAQLTIKDHLLQPWGIVHGGVYCSIVESLASVSAHVWLTANGVGGSVVGVNNNTDFLRAISAGTVTAVSTPVHRGRRQQLWVITITDENDRLVARGQVRLQNMPDAEPRTPPA